jgi:hypothetical protein
MPKQPLCKAERPELLARSRRYTSRYRDVMRAKIVLLASEGMANDAIAATPRQIVSKWRRRLRLAGLEEQPRGGGPARFPPSVTVGIKALAPPARRGLPSAHWSLSELRREAMEHGVVA